VLYKFLPNNKAYGIYFLTSSIMKGVIKKLLNGFGFITPEGEAKDIFFHANDLEGVSFESLNEGDVVSFEMGTSDKGPKAERIELA